jgi:hypothetical protein
VSILTVVSVFFGINSLEAKKQPKWEWKVKIPNEAKAIESGWNLYGNSTIQSNDGKYAIYEKNDFCDVDVLRMEDRYTEEIYYLFMLEIQNTAKDNPSAAGDYSIGFQNLKFKEGKTFIDDIKRSGDCCCCVFPPYIECIPCSRKSGCTGKCLEDFLENYDHPNWGYDHVVIQMKIYRDIENMDPGSSENTFGYMRRFDIWNTGDTLLRGNEDYHNIVCRYRIPLEDVRVERSREEDDNGNTWTVIINQDGSETDCSRLPEGTKHRELCESVKEKYKLLGLWEMYYQGFKKKAISGKEFIDSVSRIALAARTPFKYKSTWTRASK